MGGKFRLLGISKWGNKEFWILFIYVVRVVMFWLDKIGKIYGEWLINLCVIKLFNVVIVVLVNKLVWIVWVVMKIK